MTEMTSKRYAQRRTTTAAWRTCARGAAILACAVVTACEESVVAPPAAVVAASPPSPLLSAAQPSDRDILVALYEATDGPNWVNSDNWLTDAPLGEWYGVDTDASDRVVWMDLAGSWDSEARRWVSHGLAGPIPAELGDLVNLQSLFLGNNELMGPIPAELGSLTNLQSLNLGGNQLTGPIPVGLGGLANLQSLYFWGNQLTGPIPAELGDLANLQSLNLGGNELTGPIPVGLGGLTNLRSLYLWGNELTGPIPVELGGLADLRWLQLSSNQLTGPIPVELGGLTNLQSLYLGGNELTGPIPVEIGGLANLQSLYLAYNQLSGTVPLSFLQLSQLRDFRFEENADLCLPADLVAWYEALEDREGPVCRDAEVLLALYESAGGGGWTNADGWLGAGPLSEWYGVDVDSSGRVSTVDLEGNGLSGSLPDGLGNLAGLTTLRIGDNALSGRLPSSLSLTPLQELGYANTDLCVPAEVWFREWLAAIPQHEGTGVQCPPLPDRGILIALYDATVGPSWTNSGNWLTDAPLGEWYGVSVDVDGRVTDLHLGDNQLTGPIPVELGGLANLQSLSLENNDLTGPIPAELGDLANLQSLNLGGNELTGPIPVGLGGLTNLRSLYLWGNELTGPIPVELGSLANLQSLSLGSNQLAGPIPVELGSLTNLQSLYLWGNELTGPIPAELGGLTNLGYLSLGSNQLSGTIPAELGGLANLQSLYLAYNQLSGTVPLSFLQLSQLRDFRFEENADLCLPPDLVTWYEALKDREGPVCPDGEVLRALYEAAGGGGWTNADGWLGAGPLSEWYGVDVDASGRVSTVDLEGNGLSGNLPGRLGDLAGLTTLRIGDNALSGRLPSSLDRTPLRELRYANTDLCVPAEVWFQEWLAAVPEHEGTGVQCSPLSDRGILIELYEATGGPGWETGGNWLTDAPLGEWYGVRADADGRVVGLDLRSNGLEGPIPRELGGLAKLETLILFDNQLTGSIPPELGALAKAKLVVLAANQLSGPIPPELSGLADVEELHLNANQLTSVPAELGGLAGLAVLALAANEFTSVPGELGELGNLRALLLQGNQLTSVPPELGALAKLEELHLFFNELTSVPRELGELGRLRWLDLEGNRLTSVPPELGRLAELQVLWLNSNELTSVPRELGALGRLRWLFLQGNQLASVPGELGGLAELAVLSLASNELTSLPGPLAGLDNLRELYLDGNRLTDVPPGLGGFANLEILDLSSNEMRGSLPAGLVELTGLTSLGIADNAGLAGALPVDLTALERLDDLHTTGTGLCAPADPTFLDWLEGVTRQRVALCDRGGDAAAYLTQVVQSRAFPVPLVAGEPALLRVFVTAEGATNTGMPPVRATFYQDGAAVHETDIPGKPDPIPAAIDESSLSKSVNAEIPGWVIQPGLEVVIEPDPDGTLDPALGVAGRIPATGRMAVDVHAVPVFELTLVPFLWEESPDASILEITAAMAGDPEGHELLENTRLLLPVSAMDVKAHESVVTSTNNGFEIMAQTEMIRVSEGGRGHHLGVMAGPTGPGGLLGVAYDIGSWSSFSVLDSETIAHEFGHNRNLYHAPCGGAGGPDRYYPYGEGNIGAWGYDPRTGELVPPGQWDLMSYCDPYWISDYQFTNALRYRLETEGGSILVAAASPPVAPIRALLLWGGLDGEGAPYLRPAFFIDAPPTLPSAGGAYSLTGRDPGGAELFSLSFAMAEYTDADDERAGFSFALPVTWTEELASITLRGPGGSAGIDRDTDDPITILRDPATGQIRGIFDGPQVAALAPGPALAPGQGFEVLFSRGIPGEANEQR